MIEGRRNVLRFGCDRLVSDHNSLSPRRRNSAVPPEPHLRTPTYFSRIPHSPLPHNRGSPPSRSASTTLLVCLLNLRLDSSLLDVTPGRRGLTTADLVNGPATHSWVSRPPAQTPSHPSAGPQFCSRMVLSRQYRSSRESGSRSLPP